MRFRSLPLAFVAMTLAYISHAQPKNEEKLNIKFGKISPQDFDLSASKFDTSAAVVVIADIGSSEFDLSMRNDKSIIYTRHRRMKILKKSGFEAADISVPYYFSRDGEERITDLKASTYNLENGKVVETKVDSKSIFKDKLNEHNMVKKFTFPALKEGSIIEYTYSTTSDFYTQLRGWEFQCEYPVIWSEYRTAIPEIYNYVFMPQGGARYDISSNYATNADFEISHSNGARSYISIINNRWVKKNVPALKREKFTSTIDNYVDKIEFHLASIIYPMEAPRYKMRTWQSLKTGLLESEYFGSALDKNNGWLDDVLKPIIQGSKNDLDKTKKIFNYVRDNYKCSDATALFINDGLKNIVKTKAGNVAELNLLLIAMLRHEKINADPIILSTRSNGHVNEDYAILNQFNYVIAEVQIENKVYQLDASNPLLGFNHLSPKCYNGHARLVNDAMDAIYLSPDSLKEKKVTIVTVKSDEKGAMHGSYTSMLGYMESLDVRETVRDKGEADYFKVIQSSYTGNGDIEINNKGIDSLKLQDEPVQIRYEFNINKGNEDMIYFNPMLNEGIKENYFVSAERLYPVEMPFSMSEMYVLNLDIPTGYELEELPKSAQVTLNDDEGTFQFLVGKNDNMIQFKSVIKLNKATFQPEDYNSLRDFFALVVKKQSEQIVFKKKK